MWKLIACAMLFPVLAGADRAAAAGRAPVAPPASDLAVLPADAGGGEMLRAYLLRECQKCFDARRAAVAKLETPEAFLERQKNLCAWWMETNGLAPGPDRTPLKPRVVGTLECDGYRIEKVLYESRPNHHITANLYVPTAGKPPFPGVLVPCGHSANGKAAEPYQSISALLAAYGMVSLCYDPIGQGERFQTPAGPKGKPVVGGTVEHTLVDIGARLVGWSAATYRIWDGLRSIDYLVSRPEVDSKRIGCTGNSGGGTMTSYLMATDDRIWAAAPSCYLTTLERLFNTIGPQDGEQNITGQVAAGLDHADYLNLRAPKPTLMLTGSHDYFDITGAWTTFREAKRFYGILGHGERVDLFEYPDKHGFSKPRREAALRWMRRWLQGIDEPATEPKLALRTDAELQVTRTGHVVSELGGVTVWDLSLAEARRLAPVREAFWREGPKSKCLDEVRRLAAVRPPAKPPTVKAAGTIRRGGYRIEKLLLERPDEVPVPALLFIPEPCAGHLPAVLYVDGRGKAADAAPGGPVEALVREGRVVLSLDARGWGETAIAKPKMYYDNEYPVTYLAIHLARPLLGQRVGDVLAGLEALMARPEVDAARVRLVGVDAGGPVALHAAALDERFGEVVLERSIASWMEVMDTPLARNQLGQLVPGALRKYDLPDLVRAIAPRPVHVRNPVDAAGRPKAAP